ncbi:hypothetical protein FI667_g8922, partial [Globisporangium splendens]
MSTKLHTQRPQRRILQDALMPAYSLGSSENNGALQRQWPHTRTLRKRSALSTASSFTPPSAPASTRKGSSDVLNVCDDDLQHNTLYEQHEQLQRQLRDAS